MIVEIPRGRLSPWSVTVTTVKDCDRELASLKQILQRTYLQNSPGRHERQNHMRAAITALLDARLELADAEVLEGVDQCGPLPFGTSKQVMA